MLHNAEWVGFCMLWTHVCSYSFSRKLQKKNNTREQVPCPTTPSLPLFSELFMPFVDRCYFNNFDVSWEVWSFQTNSALLPFIDSATSCVYMSLALSLPCILHNVIVAIHICCLEMEQDGQMLGNPGQPCFYITVMLTFGKTKLTLTNLGQGVNDVTGLQGLISKERNLSPHDCMGNTACSLCLLILGAGNGTFCCSAVWKMHFTYMFESAVCFTLVHKVRWT